MKNKLIIVSVVVALIVIGIVIYLKYIKKDEKPAFDINEPVVVEGVEYITSENADGQPIMVTVESLSEGIPTRKQY